ncbi:outer membrane protein assembly factor BamB family protein [Polyangium mundeleinium]|uniref:PQQ-binding-like beta-propeller repeat protein n=1 Tax=Polyangium mundeleinium TaxID=2995306 RepID=A0ABT5EQA5_9BACT|nr:PQQ-binding-like beta-propeller repeat protein [Polyangium mundeleinium]MDC0742960.1 PQQ-binding-like beta-propeller repeat protein [Polyangium mundeleinium]
MYRHLDPHAPLLVLAFGGYVIAVERRTGKLVWQQQYHEPYTARLLFAPGRVLLGYHKELVCLAYTTGQVLWRTAVPTSTDSIVVDGDEIFFGAVGEAGCVDVNTGALLWHHPFTGMGTSAVALGVPGNVAQIDRSR